MRIALKLLALVASVLAFVVIVGIGLLGAIVPESGVRGGGVLLALAALIAFASAAMLGFSRQTFFEPRGRRPIVVAAALAALAPLVALAWATLQFAISSIGGDALMVAGGFALGALFILGGIAILALAAWRFSAGANYSAVDSARRVEAPPPLRPRAVEMPLRPAAQKAERATESFQGDEDIRVTHV